MTDQLLAAQTPRLQPDSMHDGATTNHVYAAVSHIYANPVKGLTIEVIDEGNVVCTTMKVANEQTIKAWGDEMCALQQYWPTERIIYILNEFPTFPSTLLNFAMSQARAVVATGKNSQSYVALIIPRDLMGQIAEFTIRAARFVERRQRMQIFFQRSDAIRWLHTCRLNEERKASAS